MVMSLRLASWGSTLATRKLVGPTDAVFEVTLLLAGSGSPVIGPTDAVLVMRVPTGVPLLTWTTKVKVAEVLAANEPTHAVTVPLLLPTGGALLLQPCAGVHETNVVLAGNPS